MSKVLVNNVTLAVGTLYAGTPVSDAAQQAAVLAAGGVLADTSNPAIAAMATLVQNYRASSRGTPEMWADMMSAVWAGGTSNGQVNEATVTSTFADFAGLGTGVKTFDYLLGSALPSKGRLLMLPSAEVWTGYDDPTHAVVQAKVGLTVGGVELGAALAVDVTTGTGFPKAFSAGGYAGEALAAAAQMHLRISSTVDLKTLTVGTVTVNVLYSLQP